MEEADYHASNHHYRDGKSRFDLKTPKGWNEGLELSLPGKANVENAVAALAAGICLGIPMDSLRKTLATFTGVVRRFDIQVHGQRLVYMMTMPITPEELKAIINAASEMFPGKKSSTGSPNPTSTPAPVIAHGLAESLNLLDELIMLDIYPARELPIEGERAQMILKKVTRAKKTICSKTELLEVIAKRDTEVLLTLGAEHRHLSKQMKELMKKPTVNHEEEGKKNIDCSLTARIPRRYDKLYSQATPQAGVQRSVSGNTR